MFRNGQFVQYGGDETSEKQILAWLTDEETLKIIGVIDEVSPCPARVVSIGRLTAFYVIFVPVELILSKTPHTHYIIVLLVEPFCQVCTWQKGSTF